MMMIRIGTELATNTTMAAAAAVDDYDNGDNNIIEYDNTLDYDNGG